MYSRREETSAAKPSKTGHWLVSSLSLLRGGQEKPCKGEDGLPGWSRFLSEDFGGTKHDCYRDLEEDRVDIPAELQESLW